MTQRGDPLAICAHRAIAEEVMSLLRHDVGNRIATVRNAAYYVRKRLSKSEAWTTDPKIETFSKLIDDHLGLAVEILDSRAPWRAVRPELGPVAMDECVRWAASHARIPDEPPVRFEM